MALRRWKVLWMALSISQHWHSARMRDGLILMRRYEWRYTYCLNMSPISYASFTPYTMRECATNSSSDSRDTYGDQERDTRVENVAHIGAVGEIGLHAHHPRGNLFVLPIDVGLERGVQLLDVRLLELRDVGVADRGLDHVGDLLAQKVGREPHDVAAQVDHRDSLVHVPHGLEQLLDDGSGAIVSTTGRE